MPDTATEKYVLLRTERQHEATKRGPSLGLGSRRVAPTVEIVVADITPREAREFSHSAGMAAPVLPVDLIKPAMHPSGVASPTGNSWGLEAIGATSSGYTGVSAAVAVLDTGIERDHPAFAHLVGKVSERNFAPDRGPNDAADDDGHGTHCAGTIFGQPVKGLRIGVAPAVDRVLIARVFSANGASDTGLVLSAIQWACEQGANVISMSLSTNYAGYQKQLVDRGFPPDIATSHALQAYVDSVLLFGAASRLVSQQAIFRGNPVAIVAATGNDSRRATNPQYRVVAGSPAAAEEVIAVGAVERTSAGQYVVAPYSNTRAIVSAPGSDIWSAKLGGGITSMSGTSMAAPHVAGSALLWLEYWRQKGQLNIATFSANVKSQAVLTESNPDDVGFGLIQVPR